MSDAACDCWLATFLELLAIHSLWLPLLGLGVCRKKLFIDLREEGDKGRGGEREKEKETSIGERNINWVPPTCIPSRN